MEDKKIHSKIKLIFSWRRRRLFFFILKVINLFHKTEDLKKDIKNKN